MSLAPPPSPQRVALLHIACPAAQRLPHPPPIPEAASVAGPRRPSPPHPTPPLPPHLSLVPAASVSRSVRLFRPLTPPSAAAAAPQGYRPLPWRLPAVAALNWLRRGPAAACSRRPSPTSTGLGAAKGGQTLPRVSGCLRDGV